MSFTGIDRPDSRTYLPALPAILAAGSAFVITGTTATTVILCRRSIPYWDQWDNLISGRRIDWAWLVSQHNEHRLLVPRLIFWIDAALFHERNDFDLIVSFAIQLATAGLLTVLAQRTVATDRLARITVAGFCFALTFSAQQWGNFIVGFQVQFFLVCFAATAASVVMVYGGRGWLSLLAVLLLNAVATYSLASGILVPLVTIALALGSRRPFLQVVMLTAAAALLLTSYLTGYQPRGEIQGGGALVGALPSLIAYTLNELGTFPAELFGLGSLGLHLAIGGLGLLLLAGLLLTNRAQARFVALAEWPLFGIALFVAGMCMLTAIGRLRFGIGQATAGRYATPVLLFWGALLPLAVSRLRSKKKWGLAGLAVMAGVAAIREPHFAVAALKAARDIDAGVPAALVMNDDRAMLARLYPEPDTVIARLPLLEAAQASVFAEPWSRWLGKPFPSGQPSARLPSCQGALTKLVPVSDGVRTGWRATGHLQASGLFPPHLVVLDAEGRVVGLGLGGLYAHSLDEREKLQNDTADHWLAEITAVDRHAFTAYLLDGADRAVCLLGSAS